MLPAGMGRSGAAALTFCVVDIVALSPSRRGRQRGRGSAEQRCRPPCPSRRQPPHFDHDRDHNTHHSARHHDADHHPWHPLAQLSPRARLVRQRRAPAPIHSTTTPPTAGQSPTPTTGELQPPQRQRRFRRVLPPRRRMRPPLRRRQRWFGDRSPRRAETANRTHSGPGESRCPHDGWGRHDPGDDLTGGYTPGDDSSQHSSGSRHGRTDDGACEEHAFPIHS